MCEFKSRLAAWRCGAGQDTMSHCFYTAPCGHAPWLKVWPTPSRQYSMASIADEKDLFADDLFFYDFFVSLMKNCSMEKLY